MSSTDQKPIYGSSTAPVSPRASKVTVPGIRNRKGTEKKVLCLTAYDYPSARLVDEAGFDLILVGDSMANVVLGHASTLKISIEQIISATRAVKRAADRPLVVADMPYGTYHVSPEDTIRNGLRWGGDPFLVAQSCANRADARGHDQLAVCFGQRTDRRRFVWGRDDAIRPGGKGPARAFRNNVRHRTIADHRFIQIVPVEGGQDRHRKDFHAR